MVEKVPNVLCGATAALEFIHVGGILAKHVKKGGKAVAVVAWEYPENVKRQIEEAAKILGVDVRILGFKRGEVTANLEAKKKVVRIIRETKPDIAIIPSYQEALVSDDPDHIATYQLFTEALGLCYRDNFAPEQIKKGLKPHFVKARYYPEWKEPTFVVDVTDVYDLKLKATLVFKEQLVFTAKVMTATFPEKAFEALIPNYREIKDDPKKLGEVLHKEWHRVGHIYHGGYADVAFGEPFKKEGAMKLDLLTL